MPGCHPYQVWQYDEFILPPQLHSSVGVQQRQTATVIHFCRYRWNTTQAAADHHGEVLGSIAIRQTSKRYKEITNAVAYHLVKDLLPLRTAEKSGYHNVIPVLDPRYILISNRFKKKKINNYWYRLTWNTWIVIHFSVILPSPTGTFDGPDVACWPPVKIFCPLCTDQSHRKTYFGPHYFTRPIFQFIFFVHFSVFVPCSALFVCVGMHAHIYTWVCVRW